MRNARTANATKSRLELKNQVSLPSPVEEAPASTTATSAEEGPLVAARQTTTVSSKQPSIATQASMPSDHDGDTISIWESIAPRLECEHCSRKTCSQCGDMDDALEKAMDVARASKVVDSDVFISVTDTGERADIGDFMDTGIPHGERNSLDLATAPGDGKYKYRRVCGPIHLVKYPPVAVCKTCKCVVANLSHKQVLLFTKRSVREKKTVSQFKSSEFRNCGS